MSTPQPPSSDSGLQLASVLRPLPAATSTPERLSDKIWRRLVDFMPVILVLLLVLATTWLVRSMPAAEEPRPAPPPNEPDYYMKEFSLRNFNPQGILQTEIQGAFGDHLPGNDTIRTQQLQSYSLDASGVVTRATADRSVSDSKGKDIELFDNVRVVRTDPRPDKNGQPRVPTVLESDYLHVINQQEHISTDRPVRITQGKDVINGSGLEYTADNKVLRVDGRVRAQIQPSPARQ
ncbi:LPS export ABC transporter periplasmic protein LptC [Brachymonas denitrificans]|uniref:Lipopolysaccharide export system protein LptC n=1 Tax=Brachymonas denitrificans DSM 15123 TaxID=1121117 RepID=A0A1H8CXV5_9BURK|nr:LPS export ABC transporter periplasmic protein LptC [Brachymonas denitrificans]SEM99274.1 lipopolysaccharide export system protein LptC [Brachymonas denitrificans DSM 15123]